MADIFNEVEEDIRKQRLELLWKKFGKFLIAGAVGAMIITGVVSYSKNAKIARETAATTAFLDAIEDMHGMTSEDAAVALSEFADDSPEGIAMLARFAAAGRAADAGNIEEATRLYDMISDDMSVPQIYKDMSAIEAILVLFDTADVEEIGRRIDNIAATPYFQLTLAELRAMLKVKDGDLYGAEIAFEAISMNENAPAPQRDRARNLSNYFGQLQYRAAHEDVEDVIVDTEEELNTDVGE